MKGDPGSAGEPGEPGRPGQKGEPGKMVSNNTPLSMECLSLLFNTYA